MRYFFVSILTIGMLLFATAQEKATLSVHYEKGSARVYIDTAFVGLTPINSIPLEAGSHILRFLSADSVESLNWFHSPVIETVNVAMGEHISKNVEFKQRSYIPVVIAPQKPSTDNAGKIPATALNGKIVPSTTPLYLTTVGAILSGTVAAYFKIKADKEYDTYQYEGDVNALDRVKRYDTISGIALATCEINLAALTYFLLSR